ncbi:MAG0110 family membrane protein [Mesomycoplasma lagogenitalium]|uniref:Inhibitor of apoptosis-promoting Bax1 n=1 Tax=Mesomycoplasma lagogenitalium TaxID=171286 RepID=A0ABY8LT03_9BACT|nr:hypothetical protein [Mesomycoplasma lagogenitalium]WGI36377.1 hypothetical protein QEG99_02800 [Mesomycoplasma lagogenitalium]
MFKEKRQQITLTKEQTKVKNRLLSYSIGWLAFGLLVTFMIVYAVLTIEPIKLRYSLLINYFTENPFLYFIHLIYFLINILLFRFISYKSYEKNIFFLIFAYILLILIQSIWIPLFIYSLIDYQNIEKISKIILALLIPVAALLVFGILGYFGIINFVKFIVPFALITSISIIILFFIFLGTRQDWIYTIIIVISLIYTFTTIGYTFNRIQYESSYLMSTGLEDGDMKLLVAKASINYGFLLLSAFIRIFIDIIILVRD